MQLFGIRVPLETSAACYTRTATTELFYFFLDVDIASPSTARWRRARHHALKFCFTYLRFSSWPFVRRRGHWLTIIGYRNRQKLKLLDPLLTSFDSATYFRRKKACGLDITVGKRCYIFSGLTTRMDGNFVRTGLKNFLRHERGRKVDTA